MLKAVIIEDEVRASNLLQVLVEKNHSDVSVVDKCFDLPRGVRSIKKHHPEIVFLDIEMPGYSGLQILDFFDESEIQFHIIFTTAFNEYAIKAFELSAIDYLLKPIQIDQLNRAVEKVKKIHSKTNAQVSSLVTLQQNLSGSIRKIALPVAGGIEVVNLTDILYIKAEGSYCTFYLTTDAQHLISKNLKHFEDLLGPASGFFRCHRSYLINTEHIKKVMRTDGGLVQFTNQLEVPITSEKIDELLQMLT
ncbi:MAG: DNA-binding response regulator [Bacteroidetes bacterium]|nr:MAG: DNA-binding response regulator [Bacteroidota bacterium]TAE70579.1 MAG: DNA-binding response regulator [Bacteroidota bacterium]TAF93688.1 MAG: DNA-binding response regulator [Bacteroidota bacterium]